MNIHRFMHTCHVYMYTELYIYSILCFYVYKNIILKSGTVLISLYSTSHVFLYHRYSTDMFTIYIVFWYNIKKDFDLPKINIYTVMELDISLLHQKV